MDTQSLGTKRDSFTLWKGGGLFRYALEWGKILTSCEIRRDSSAFWSEGKFPWYWERGKLLPSFQVREMSSALWSEGWFTQQKNHHHHHHHHRFVHSLKWEGTLPSFEMKESPFILRNEDRFFHIWKWNEEGPFHPLKWRRVPMSLAITSHSSILWNQWGLICRRSEGGYLDPRRRK